MKRRKIIKLNKIQQALVRLAEHIERNPLNEYKVRDEIIGLLGFEEIKEKPQTASCADCYDKAVCLHAPLHQERITISTIIKRYMTKIKSSQKRVKKIKAYCVLNPRNKEISQNSMVPQYAIYSTEELAGTHYASWPIIPCTILYTPPSKGKKKT